MHTTGFAAIALLTASTLCVAAAPKAVIEIDVGGKTYQVQDGATIDLPPIAAGTLRATIQKAKNRKFTAAGLGFELPPGYRAEHDPSPPESWSFDGDDVMLNVYRNDVDDEETPAQYVTETFRIGGHACTPEPVTYRAGGRDLPGSQCDALAGEIRTHREVFLLATPQARWLFSFLLVHAVDREASAELNELKRRIAATLTLESQ